MGISSGAHSRISSKSSPRVVQRHSRVRTPTILQMEAVECGATCLGIILAWHGRYVSMEELRLTCGVSRDGSKASHLIRAAREFGLDAHGYTIDLPDLHEVPLPFVIFWQFKHFVVVEGFGQDKVFINDPATGPRSISYAEFDSSFTGIVLTFEKTAGFKKGGNKPSLFKALLSRIHSITAPSIYIVLATLALVLLNLGPPAFARIYLDEVLTGTATEWLKPLLVAIIVIALLRGLTTYLQQTALLRAEIRLSLDMSRKFFWHILQLPMDFFSQRLNGEIGSRIDANDRVASLLTGELATNAVNVVLIGFYAVLMFAHDRLLTIISIAIVLINLAALQYIARRRTDDNRHLLQTRGKLVGVSMAGIQLIESIKSTGSESAYFSRWAGQLSSLISAEQALGTSSQILAAIPPFLAALSLITVLVLGGIRNMNGMLTIGMLIAFQTLMTSLAEPVNQMVELGSQLQQIQGDLSRLDDVLNYPVDSQFKRGEKDDRLRSAVQSLEQQIQGSLELRNISFGYSHFDPPFIQDFSLKLSPGQRVALVGGSGSGKSTIAKIAAGLYQPWSGEVLIDDLPREGIERETLAASIAVVEQDVVMIEGTITDNLKLWDSRISEQAIIDAARCACIHDDIVNRFGGYHECVEEAARNLSGGQRQRLEIARALASKPKILILDEATSSLDPLTENTIANNIRQLGCSCLIVAHRLSTIRDCEEILVMEEGRIVQRGTHQQLIQVDGPYAQLLDMEIEPA